jgi:hypothetical protein
VTTTAVRKSIRTRSAAAAAAKCDLHEYPISLRGQDTHTDSNTKKRRLRHHEDVKKKKVRFVLSQRRSSHIYLSLTLSLCGSMWVCVEA